MNFDEFVTLQEVTMSPADHANKIRASANKFHDATKANHKPGSMEYKDSKFVHEHMHKIANHVEKGNYSEAQKLLHKNRWVANSLIGKSQHNHINKHA